MNQGFSPEGYEVPKTGGAYMKFRPGANKFRILSAPIIGYEYWTEDRKPVRSKTLWKTIPVDADITGENGWNPKHFWAFVVYNLDEKAIQILEVTQSSILSRLQTLVQNEDWGDPREYNITVTRSGEGLGTKYEVDASPHKPTPPEILADYKEKKIDLEALFEGKSPFEASERNDEIDAKEFRPKVVKGAMEAKEDFPDDVPF